MFKHLLLAAALTVGVALPFSAFSARVVEVRKRADVNPTIYCAGVEGNPELSAALRNFLDVCGWFDPARDAASADYVLNASGSSGALTVRLFQKQTPIAAWQFRSAGGARTLAKIAVDTIIERVFEQLKVRGFCQSRIAFGAESAPGIRNIFICDIDGRDVEQLTNYRTMNVEPCWSPDGRSIYFSKYGHTGIEVIETTVAKPRRSRLISSFRGINTGAAVSPDGSRLAVILSPDHNVDLYTLGLGRRERRRLTQGIAVEASPCWSPDGREIAFVSDESGSPRIYIMNASGGAKRRLPTVGADAVTPAWNSDGKIAYASRVNGSYQLAVYDLKSGENKQVTKGAGNWESPEWAADNRQVVCKRSSGSSSALYVVDTRTGRDRLLLRTGARLFDPAWSPCRQR